MVSIILRQLDLNTASETERRLFDLAHPEFAQRVQGRGTLTLPLPTPSKTNESRLHRLGEADFPLLYEQTKPRRYAGGSDVGFQRYHAVVGSEEASSDDGTLISEIQEYSDPDRIFHTGSVVLFDGAMAKDRQLLAELGVEWDHDPSTIICAFFPLHERHITAASDLLGPGRPTTVILALRTRLSEIDSEGILDLRCLSGQRELVELVRSSEFLRSKFDDPDDRDLFLHCIPMIIAAQRGGTFFHAYVGHTLRRRGVNGLIYPSARRDAATEVVNGNLARWTGWCLIDYRGTPLVKANVFESFAEYSEELWRPAILSDAARIVGSTNPVYAGSFSVTGVENDRWRLISAIKRNAQKRAAEILLGTKGPRAFSLEESELLSRALREPISKEWKDLGDAAS
jgi:hypothetical protein